MVEDLRKITVSHDELAKEITERKRAEEQYTMVLRTTISGFWITDIQGHFLDVNDAYCRLIGYSRDELLKMGIPDIEVIERPEETAQHIHKIMAVGGERFETRHRCKDGKIVDIEVSVNYTKERGGQLFVFLRDITERKETEEKLLASESKNRMLLENLPQKIFFKDKNSVYVSCNENYAYDLKIKPEEIAGKTDYDFYPKELAEKYRADDKRIISLGRTEDIEEKYIQDGQEIFVHTVKTPVKDGQGNIIGILGVFWDVTERNKLEEELKKKMKSLERFNRVAVGRELKMMELKKRIKELEARAENKNITNPQEQGGDTGNS
jgi:PAS domain S-box-containing protein